MSEGFNNMLHFVGVVEDIHDRTNSGRVRVRAFGIHPPRAEEGQEDSVPTAHLPWATVLDGTYGVAPVIPSVGEWVFGFFIDGREAQQPIITGRLPGMHLQMPAGSGEPGEDGYLPDEAVNQFGAPPLHRYQGGEDAQKGQTLSQRVFQNNNIVQADGDSFDEPPVMMPENNYDNRLVKSKDGDNFIVLGSGQDGDNNDYILISHSSGSVFQIDANGTMLVKSFSDKYNTTDGVESNYITGSQHTNIQDDYTLKVENGKGKIQIAGNFDIECTDFNVKASRNINLNAGAKINASGLGVGVYAKGDDINLVAHQHLKASTAVGGMYFKCISPGVPTPGMTSNGGDFHVDSYKMNLHSLSYTKLHSTGLPAVSAGLLPYPDVGHNGIDIYSTTSLRMNSLATMNISTVGVMGINAGGAMGVTAGGAMNLYAVGTLGIGATLAVSLDSVVPTAGVLIGNGTAGGTLSAGGASVTASLAPQLVQSTVGAVPNISVTEIASCVKPPDIEHPVVPLLTPLVKRVKSVFTSMFGSGDNLD